MRVVRCLAIVLVFIAGAGCGPGEPREARDTASAPASAAILLANVRVFDVASGEMGPARDILVDGGRIAAVGEEIAVSDGAERIDCSGKFAVPGLFDCHTHLSFLTTQGDEETRGALRRFVSSGITQVRDVGGPIDVIAGMSASIARGDFEGPEIFYTGPMLEKSPMHWSQFNEELPGFTVAIDSREDVDRVLQELADKGAGLVKTFNRIDRDVYAHLVETARAHSLRVVHDPGMPLFHSIPMDWAIEQGVTSIEHGKSPWPVVLADDLKERHDELLAEGAEMPAMMSLTIEAAGRGVESVSRERLDRLIDLMLERNVYLCPTLQVLDEMGSERPEGVAPEEWEVRKKVVAGMKTVGAYFTSEMSKRGVRVLVGQDGNSPDATFNEMGRLRECGVPEAEIIRGATLYPAQWLGVEERIGSIEPGKEARILVLEQNPLDDIGNMRSAFLVVSGGRVIRADTED